MTTEPPPRPDARATVRTIRPPVVASCRRPTPREWVNLVVLSYWREYRTWPNAKEIAAATGYSVRRVWELRPSGDARLHMRREA